MAIVNNFCLIAQFCTTTRCKGITNKPEVHRSHARGKG